MLKNEEIRQKYPFFRKGLNDFSQKRVKRLLWLCGYWVYQKLLSHSVTQVAITLS